MAKRLGPDGTPIDILTVPRRRRDSPVFADSAPEGDRSDGRPPSGDDPTAAPQNRRRSIFYRDTEPPTRPVTRPGGGATGTLPAATRPIGVERPGPDLPPPGADGEPPTVIHGGWNKGRRTEPAETAGGTDDVSGMTDPVVGWLVVVEGPGKGRSVQLGSGQNHIGRGRECRVSLNFGDDRISRASHAMLTYDPEANKFYISPGQGTNLVYLNRELVMAPMPLPNGSTLKLGRTQVRFVACCDSHFSWGDSGEPTD